MKQDFYYLTTPIYYVNSNPHLGHAYTSILADASARFHEMLGQRALLLTGTDEHGDKIVKAAQAKQREPGQFVDEISSEFRSLWPKLAVTAHRFTRTTDKEHIQKVQTFLQKIYDAGDIYFGEFGGHYCFGCERFYTEKELQNGLCPQHLTAPEYISEKNYFFRMSAYLPWLKKYMEEHPDLIRPDRYRKEALAMLEDGVLEDLCISRPKSRLTWGIELPFDHDYVCYVWFDALVSYIAGIDWPDGQEFQDFWPGEHLIAKDILKPHAIFWPCMLKAAGLPVYRHLNVHGYWLSRDTKMSKSLGNVVEPLAASEHFGLDCFRYFLLREMRFGADASFGEEAVISRVNSDLANDLGNLFSRVLSMNGRYCDGKAPIIKEVNDDDKDVIELCEHTLENYIQLLTRMEFSLGLENLMQLARGLNKYVDTQAPWSLYKEGKMDRVATVLGVLLACLRKLAICLWPIMPKASCDMLRQLGMEQASQKTPPVTNLQAECGSFNPLPQGVKLAANSNLFPRMEPCKANKEKDRERGKETQRPEKGRKQVKIEDFQALGITAGRVVKAEKHPNAERILRLEIDFGESEPRQILSGIAEYFAPDELQGRMVCAALNLAPRKIRGLVSNGMLLTCESGDGLRLLDPGQDVQPGSPIA